jgi:hypothetical protein
VRGAIEHVYRARKHPGLTDAGWSQASPVAKQAAVGSALQVVDEYARASAAAGGFDRPDAHLDRRVIRVDAKGFADLSKACAKLLAQAEKIEATAAERIAKKADGDGDGEGVVEAGLGVLLFEALRLTGPADEERAKRRRSPRRRAG